VYVDVATVQYCTSSIDVNRKYSSTVI